MHRPDWRCTHLRPEGSRGLPFASVTLTALGGYTVRFLVCEQCNAHVRGALLSHPVNAYEVSDDEQ